MTDLDTVLKRGDVTLPTKLCIAKATPGNLPKAAQQAVDLEFRAISL